MSQPQHGLAGTVGPTRSARASTIQSSRSALCMVVRAANQWLQRRERWFDLARDGRFHGDRAGPSRPTVVIPGRCCAGRALKGAGISTRRGFAGLAELPRLDRVSPDVLRSAQRQARLQVASEGDGPDPLAARSCWDRPARVRQKRSSGPHWPDGWAAARRPTRRSWSPRSSPPIRSCTALPGTGARSPCGPRQWSAYWDKKHGLRRVAEDDLDSDLYAESSDVDTVISYIVAHT